MFELMGQYNSATVFAEQVDADTLRQLHQLLNQESIASSRIRIMPDCHAGKGCVIGTTMTIHDSVIPNLVGIDIGCGMLAVKLKDKAVDLPGFDNLIREYIPSGTSVHKNPIHLYSITQAHIGLRKLRCFKHAHINENLAYNSIGTLGSGNHFIELDRDSHDDLWLVVHSGSRHLGIEVCTYYQNMANKEAKRQYRVNHIEPEQRKIIAELKAKGCPEKIPAEIKRLNAKADAWRSDTPADLMPCTGSLMEDYIHDMQIVQAYAKLNRRAIADLALQYVCSETDSFDTVHNYVDPTDMILRKGAIAAYRDQRVLIPINMRDGSLICTGKGNPDWNYSAPHGAGRLFSRSETKARYSLEKFRATMQRAGVWTSCISESTLSEYPMAYKPMDSIMGTITDTVNIVDTLTPIYNFKA